MWERALEYYRSLVPNMGRQKKNKKTEPTPALGRQTPESKETGQREARGDKKNKEWKVNGNGMGTFTFTKDPPNRHTLFSWLSAPLSYFFTSVPFSQSLNSSISFNTLTRNASPRTDSRQWVLPSRKWNTNNAGKQNTRSHTYSSAHIHSRSER